jgi:ABC-type sulfate transport system permease subunit
VTVKLIMTWDIKAEHEQEYFEFVIREFIPGIQRLGAELTDAWATVYGSGPVSYTHLTLPTN